MKVIKDTQQQLVLQELSMGLYGLLFWLSFNVIPIIVVSMLIWESLGVNTLNCQRLESAHINCTAQKFNGLRQMFESVHLEKLHEGRIVQQKSTDSDALPIYALILHASNTNVSFYESKEEPHPASELRDVLQSFINDTGRVSFSIETAPKSVLYSDIAILVFISGIWLFIFGVLPIGYYLEGRNTTHHFDKITRKLHTETYNRIRKLTEKEIAFKQIEKITLEEKSKVVVDDEDKTSSVITTFSLFLHLLDSEPLLIWRTNNDYEYAEIKKIAQRMAEITDAEYNGLSETAEALIPSGKPTDPKTQAKPLCPTKKKFFVWLIILLILLFIGLNFRTIQNFFSNGQSEFFTSDLRENTFSSWLSENEYQRLFNHMAEKKHYPIVVEGRENNGIIEFRAMFAKFPSGEFYFYSWVGDSSKKYEARDKKLTAQGFRLVWHHQFTTSRSAILHQTVWVKQGTK